nr:hypothetical protein [Tanacetum cinerariifolium]
MPGRQLGALLQTQGGSNILRTFGEANSEASPLSEVYGLLVRAYYSISSTKHYKDESCWNADVKSKTTKDIISNRSFMEVLVLNYYVLVKNVLSENRLYSGDLDSSRLSVLKSFLDDRNSHSGSLKGVNCSIVELLVMHYLKQRINNQ